LKSAKGYMLLSLLLCFKLCSNSHIFVGLILCYQKNIVYSIALQVTVECWRYCCYYCYCKCYFLWPERVNWPLFDAYRGL